ncbi:hypothetical protein Lcho_2181 [Leptothrix cholodnii SP-6]|uniref:Phage protein, HK97 gp10 family n=1 Tax=Leptothrix cholodnii (strain ATCC 51168 / LMG 8142 / SP-6) TaxID=395495 RepID=B1Y2V5_LEPCP|nr:hypothetical protein [Leptothrix cholodnii]ACB34447.1 hypothetical protein Lcho_2181 [Leptothrix cholodnii SP-6]
MKLDVTLSGTEAVRRTLLRIGQQTAKNALDKTAEDLEKYVGEQAGEHKNTGALWRSVYNRPVGNGYEIGHDLQVAPHALFVHWGTKPHKIRPKNTGVVQQNVRSHTRNTKHGAVQVSAHTRDGKSMLRWPGGGKFFFAKEVNHPGYKGDPWLERAAAQAPAIFERHVAAVLAKIERGG